MRSIKSKDTKVEMMLRSELWKRGHRYRTHMKLPGSPDVVFTKKKVAVFIDGDFWHGYEYKKLKPKLKNEFWVNKIKRNKERDKEVNKKLRKEGWKVIRVWEHEIRNDLPGCVKKIDGIVKKWD